MILIAYDERDDKYKAIDEDTALRRHYYWTVHPLSENQIDIPEAVSDAMDCRNGEHLAYFLVEQLMREFYWNNVHLREFLRHLSIKVNGCPDD